MTAICAPMSCMASATAQSLQASSPPPSPKREKPILPGFRSARRKGVGFSFSDGPSSLGGRAAPAHGVPNEAGAWGPALRAAPCFASRRNLLRSRTMAIALFSSGGSSGVAALPGASLSRLLASSLQAAAVQRVKASLGAASQSAWADLSTSSAPSARGPLLDAEEPPVRGLPSPSNSSPC